MKIRNFYISNSSSSSYIIKFKDFTSTITIAGEEISIQDFFSLLETIHDSDSELKEISTTKEDSEKLINYLNTEIEWSADNEYKIKLIELKKEIESTTDHYYAKIDLSYHNNGLRFLFNLLVKYNLIDICFCNKDY